MALVDGLDDLVEGEYARLRGELKGAIAESEYTLAQVAALAGVGERTLRNVLAGPHAAQIDTLLRVAFVVGVRIELADSAEGSRPFQVVPLATSGRRRSQDSASQGSARGRRAGSDNVASSSKSTKRKAANQGRKRGSRNPINPG